MITKRRKIGFLLFIIGETKVFCFVLINLLEKKNRFEQLIYLQELINEEESP